LLGFDRGLKGQFFEVSIIWVRKLRFLIERQPISCLLLNAINSECERFQIEQIHLDQFHGLGICGPSERFLSTIEDRPVKQSL
jgi:hypothetical protein